MYRHLPNQLTLLRLVLAGIFFVTLDQYQYDNAASDGPLWLWISAALFILAACTDALDGHLARKWHVESTFGRIMDPFCDKVLVLGAFVYLAGPGFVTRLDDASGSTLAVSGIHPWMVAVMLARELLVTGVRGELEGTGVQFGANIFGKVKMLLQSFAVPIILIGVWIDPGVHPWLLWTLRVMAYALVTVTLLSGLPYLIQAGKAMRRDGPAA